jgi:hypothetical protein
MKNMKWKSILALFLAVAIFIGVPRAEANVKITIKNNRPHNMSFAFRWAGFDGEMSGNKGWHNVKAGETKTFTMSEAIYGLTSTAFGYYATGGGNIWKGNNDNGIYGWIHPKNAFNISTNIDGGVENPVSGMQKVLFRVINLKKTGDPRDTRDGAATLTFNP